MPALPQLLSMPALPRPLLQVPKPDVVMTSYEAFTADAAELKAITWEAVSRPGWRPVCGAHTAGLQPWDSLLLAHR